MKKLIITLAICIGVLSARAGYMPSELTIRMWDYSVISLVFDGQIYDQYNTTYKLTGIDPGNHLLKVYRYYTNPQGGLSPYPKMVFSGYIKIKPGMSVDAMINNYAHFVILHEVSLMPHGNHYGHYNNNGPHPGNNYNANDYDNNYYYTSPGMNSYEFMELKSIVSNTSFDNSKLAICKQAISSNTVSSSQVFELMSLLSFESSKLELAKFAYYYVVDKNRFYVVNNAFSFSSSIDELNDFIYRQ
jgi:hypothetical protein